MEYFCFKDVKGFFSIVFSGLWKTSKNSYWKFENFPNPVFTHNVTPPYVKFIASKNYMFTMGKQTSRNLVPIIYKTNAQNIFVPSLENITRYGFPVCERESLRKNQTSPNFSPSVGWGEVTRPWQKNLGTFGCPFGSSNGLRRILLISNLILSLVDGKWGKWGAWSGCPVTCGGGNQKRTRKCNKPKPKGGGKRCDGSEEDTRQCNTFNCGRK